MSTGDSDKQWTQPGDSTGSAPSPAPSGYGTPSSPSYGKYGQGTALPVPPSAPTPPGAPVWGPPNQPVQPNWSVAPAGFKPSGQMATAVIVLSVLYTITDWLMAIFAPTDGKSLGETLQADSDSASATLGTYDYLALASFPVMLAAWLVTSIWLDQARGNAVLLNPQGQRRSRGWVWFGWVIPIVYLWFPKQILDDVISATEPATGAGRSTGTNTYWTLWVTSILIGAIGSGAAVAGAEDSVQRVFALLEAGVLTASLVPWVRLVLRISAAQNRLAGAGAPPR